MSPKTTDEKLAAVVAHALKQTTRLLAAMPALVQGPGLQGGFDALTAETFDLFRKSLTDEEIDWLYARAFDPIAERVTEKMQTLDTAMYEAGKRLLGPHLTMTFG